ncbi:MAG: GGDEF domain-containing protein, partial [Rectinemataceae bacterium]
KRPAAQRGRVRSKFFDLNDNENGAWNESLRSDLDDFRKKTLIASLAAGFLIVAVVGIVTIKDKEYRNLLSLVFAAVLLTIGMFFSYKASHKGVGVLSHLVLGLAPLFYLAAVLLLRSHYSYVILLVVMPLLVTALSPQKEKLIWQLYTSAAIVLANVLPLFGISSSWRSDFTTGGILAIHAAVTCVAALGLVFDSKRTHDLDTQAAHILTDFETGLPSHVALEGALRTENESIVCIVSIDNFYELSTFFGYEFAGEILIFAANRLAEESRKLGGQAFRLHGRDLGFICSRSGMDEAEVDRTVRRLHASLGGPAILHGRQVELRYSIGYSYCSGGGTAAKALNEAGGALWRSSGLHTVVCHDEKVDANVAASFARFATLSRNINEGGLEVHFQPVVRFSDGKRTWYEALLRIRGDSGNLELPAEYLDIARSAGYWEAISDFVLSRVVERIESGEGSVSMNVGIADLERESFRRAAIAAAAIGRRSGAMLILEFLETESDSFEAEQLDLLNELKTAGCMIAIDDFGMGYSNYSRLLSFPADIVKFDRSLCTKAFVNNAASTLVEGLARFCADAGTLTVVEGVETEESAEYFAAMGFDFGQGFYWSKAIPERDAPAAEAPLEFGPRAQPELSELFETDGAGRRQSLT